MSETQTKSKNGRIELTQFDDEIVRLYCDEQLSSVAVGKALGICHSSVEKRLKMLGIPRRDRHDPIYGLRRRKKRAERPKKWNEDREFDEEFKQLRADGVSWAALATHFGITRSVARSHGKRLGLWLPLGKRVYLRGPAHPLYKNEPFIASSGYRWVRLSEDDPYLPMATLSTWVLEHRLVMARHVGRCLETWEIVHHRNGDKLDNRIENLELIARMAEHTSTIVAQREWRKLKGENAALRIRVQYLEARLLEAGIGMGA